MAHLLDDKTSRLTEPRASVQKALADVTSLLRKHRLVEGLVEDQKSSEDHDEATGLAESAVYKKSKAALQRKLDRLHPADIAEYTGEQKNTGPVTLATYQILTWRESRESEFAHLELFRARSWGLIIYDEVHLLPAPVFRATADLQARRRLGLTAPSCEKMNARRTSSLSSGLSVSMFPGKTWNARPGLPAPPASNARADESRASNGICTGGQTVAVPHRC